MKKKEVKVKTENSLETIELGERLSYCLKKGDLILVKGELGAGKSTFIKGIGKGFKILNEIKSPSFIIVNEYKGKELSLYHIDLYRINGVEIFELGLKEFLNKGVVAIEWADKVEEFFSDFDLIEVKIEILSENERLINIIIKGEDLIKRCYKFH
ncbi:MAG: tRNA (adenosine(37)-N6)-threonylcarbamoyltransferase complex ATPase subunit type 1 TsaE [Caldisericia bacterium]|nr:tRNA (adenosine(37)-N6)-threonylcarbamoyltransferase complex ATPase subunit type 1 TsaE [Caldisericia bacterium]